MPGTHSLSLAAGRQGAQLTFRRQLTGPNVKVVMVTLVPPPSECKRPDAADMAQMLLMSKQDYARWHSYELHVSTAVSPGVRSASPQLAHACRVQQCAAWHACVYASVFHSPHNLRRMGLLSSEFLL